LLRDIFFGADTGCVVIVGWGFVPGVATMAGLPQYGQLHRMVCPGMASMPKFCLQLLQEIWNCMLPLFYIVDECMSVFDFHFDFSEFGLSVL
jgi:hypothetical protein